MLISNVMKNDIEGEDTMFQVAKGVRESAIQAASEMLAAGKNIAPIRTPEGNASLYVSTDESLLMLSFMEIQHEGQTFHVGVLA